LHDFSPVVSIVTSNTLSWATRKARPLAAEELKGLEKGRYVLLRALEES